MSVDYREHFDWVADHDEKARRFQDFFHKETQRLLRHHIPEGRRVLEWGCGVGELLDALQPRRGLGVDISPRMIEKAQDRFRGGGLEFREGDLHDERFDERFDAIIVDDLARYLTDVQCCLENLHGASGPRTRLYITSLNLLWRPVLAVAERLGLAMRHPPSNWLSRNDLTNLLELAGWEVITWSTEHLLPVRVPLLSRLCNRFLVRLPLLRHLGAMLFLVARPIAAPSLTGEVSCTVVVPARNEAGNIRSALQRIPVLGRGTEVVFVEGHSCDDTWDVIQQELAQYAGPHRVQALRQPGRGKWDAVRAGFAEAAGEVLVIQDGDLTATPEELPKFYDAITQGMAELANGSRLVYPMEGSAMRFLNLLGNKLFALGLSFIIAQPIKDSLCGTKMLLREDYERLIERIRELGDFDPFGDFDLIFGAALLDLRIRDIPVRYRARTYGDTNISRFRHGAILLQMCWFGLRRLRFHR
jgi:SAM-dependent methyltransferase